MPVEAVGAYLRDMRERRGISLDEVSRQTRVPVRYLEALEATRLEDLPAPVFVRGFVRAYCQALREPPEHALACLDGRLASSPGVEVAAPVVRKTVATPAEGGATVRSRARPAVIASLVLLIVLGGALVSLTMVVHPRDDRRAAEAPGPLEVSEVEQASPGSPQAVDVPSLSAPATPPALAPAPAPAKGAPAVAPVSAVTPPPASAPAPATVSAGPATATPAARDARGVRDSTYRLIARTTESTWIRVRTGDGRTIEETLPAGAVREWVSSRPFELTVGNAGGVLLELNGRALPPLGPSGTVVSRLVVPAEPR